MTTTETQAPYFTHVYTPPVKVIDKSTPMSCLQSMGLMDAADGGGSSTPTDIARKNKEIEAAGFAEASVKMWRSIGGVDTTYVCSPINLRTNGEVDGPADIADLERSPVVCVRTRCGRTGKSVMAAFAINRVGRIADICVYDPLAEATEENMYQMAGTLGAWLRDMLGEGWGLRIEVYHERYAPTEIPELSRFWLFLMCLIKMYLPHVRMIDTQAALRVECFSKGLVIKDAVYAVLNNVHKIVTSPFSK